MALPVNITELINGRVVEWDRLEFKKGWNRVFPDRMEILSFPGPMPPINQMMLKEPRIPARQYRNRRIGDFLKELHLTEGRGSGFPIIYRAMENNGSPLPEFITDEDKTYFLATLKSHPEFIKALETRVRIKMPLPKNLNNINTVEDINALIEFYLSSGIKNDFDNNKDSANDQVSDQEIFSLKPDIQDVSSFSAVDFQNNDKENDKENDKAFDRVNEIISNIINDKEGFKMGKILTGCLKPLLRKEVFMTINMKTHSDNFNRYIKPLIDLGWLEMTNPENPKYRFQKYQTTNRGKILLQLMTKEKRS